MKRFIEGEDRTQVSLLPACLEDYVEAENPVRVVEVFVDGRGRGLKPPWKRSMCGLPFADEVIQ
jgi:hypothetical protein